MIRLVTLALAAALAAPGAQAQSRDGARMVLMNARTICDFEGNTSWKVTCPAELLQPSQRLEFAKAIANSDAYVTGVPRRIQFVIRGKGVFAEADPQTGIREVTLPAASGGTKARRATH